MRLCVISGTFHPEPGGPPTYLYHLLPALVERGHQVTVVTYGERHDPTVYPYHVIRLTRQRTLMRRLLAFTQAVLDQGRQADVLFVSDYGLPAALANVWLGKPLVIKIVADFAWEFALRRGWTKLSVLEFQTARHPLPVRLVRFLERWYTRQADRVIVPSRHVERLVRGWGIDQGKLRLIYNALPSLHKEIPSKQEARRVLKWPSDELFLVSVGRVAEVKRLDLQLHALVKLPRGRLVIVGDGPQRSELEHLAGELGLAERVIFTGSWPHDQAMLAIRAADVFVLSSSTEGLSHVLLEAMQLGTPRVASDVGGNAELITNGVDGFLVPYGDVEALTVALQGLLDDPQLRERLAQAALEHARQFSWDALVSQTEAVFMEAASA